MSQGDWPESFEWNFVRIVNGLAISRVNLFGVFTSSAVTLTLPERYVSFTFEMSENVCRMS